MYSNINVKLKRRIYNVKIRYKVSVEVINNITSEFQAGILEW